MNTKSNNQVPFWIGVFLLVATFFSSCGAKNSVRLIPVTADDEPPYPVYLPLLFRNLPPAPTPTRTPTRTPTTSVTVLPPSSDTPLIHIPHGKMPGNGLPEMAIFWFGKVNLNNNYYDVRIGYDNQALYVYTAAFDRLLWYDDTPASITLTDWDAISLYIAPNDGSQLVANQSFLFVAGLAPQEANRADYQRTYTWTGSSWSASNLAFTSEAGWRGGGFNNTGEDDGWSMSFRIPFSSLGIPQTPATGTTWRLGLIGHDRDSQGAQTITPQVWPAAFASGNFGSWGRISFGLLNKPVLSGNVQGTITVREGVNNAIVEDAGAGGHTICGEGMNFWTQWGERVYNDAETEHTANIQNQRDIADWPCFSKFYLKFPISSVPANRSILRATLKMHLYGNAGNWGDPVFQPYRSSIQVGMTPTNWSENTLNWNNAPVLLENIAQTWVEPEQFFPDWPGVPYEWDVTLAARAVMQSGNDLLGLVMYSADGAYHSGKYFSTSEVPAWNAAARPTLIIEYGTP